MLNTQCMFQSRGTAALLVTSPVLGSPGGFDLADQAYTQPVKLEL
jgi:hypothetical protein